MLLSTGYELSAIDLAILSFTLECYRPSTRSPDLGGTGILQEEGRPVSALPVWLTARGEQPGPAGHWGCILKVMGVSEGFKQRGDAI